MFFKNNAAYINKLTINEFAISFKYGDSENSFSFVSYYDNRPIVI